MCRLKGWGQDQDHMEEKAGRESDVNSFDSAFI
jgi:hypothetical protein